MSTPQDRIPKPDATSVNRPRERDPNVGWREFIRQFIPEGIRDIVLPGTEEAREGRERRRIDETIPYGKEFPYASESRDREINRLFDQEQAGFEPVASDIELGKYGKMYEGIVPEDVRANISAALDVPFKASLGPAGGLIESTPLSLMSKVPLGSVLKGTADVSGVTGLVTGESPFEMIEGPVGGMATGAIPFGQKLFNRIDRAVDAFPQGKATGSQWLKQLTTGVPKQESQVIGEILGHNPNQIYTKDEIKGLIDKNYKAPVVEEVRFGGSPKKFELIQETPTRWKLGNFEIIDESGRRSFNQNFAIYTDKGAFAGTTSTLDEAKQFIDNGLLETISDPTKWEQYKIPGGENYEEIVLTTPEGGIFDTTHWEDVENPIAHLRMTTREGFLAKDDMIGGEQHFDDMLKRGLSPEEMANEILPDPPKLKIRQIDELQSDWAQQIRRSTDIRPKTPEDMPPVDFGNLTEPVVGRKIIEYDGLKFHIIRSSDSPERITAIQLVTEPFGGSPRHVVIGNRDAEKYIKNYAYVNRSANMPFAQTDQWVDLALERAIQNAIDEGADMLTWAPSQLQYDLYGSNIVGWQPGRKLLNEVEKFALKSRHLVGGRTRNIENIKDVRTYGYTLDEAKNLVANASQQKLDELFPSRLVDNILENRKSGVSDEFFNDLVGDSWEDDVLRNAIEAGPFGPDATNPKSFLSEAEIKLTEDYLKMKDVKNSQYTLTSSEITQLEKKYEAYGHVGQVDEIAKEPIYKLEEELAIVKEDIDLGSHDSQVLRMLNEKADLFEEVIRLKKEGSSRPTFMINAKRQYRGEIPGIGNLEELAMGQGGTYGEIREAVSSRDELEKVLREILENPKDAPRTADKLWERMQTTSEGVSLPRKEGMDYFYDKMIPKRIKEVGKKIGVKLTPEEILVNYPQSTKFKAGVKQMGIRITDELKEAAKKGWPTLGILGAMGASQIEKKIDKEPEDQTNPLDQLFD